MEPWIQWHSIHTGNTAEDHGIFRLGDAVYSKKKQIFEELEQEKLKIGSISAMNTINNLKNPYILFKILGQKLKVIKIISVKL